MILPFGFSRPLILVALGLSLAACSNETGSWFNTAQPTTLEPEEGYGPRIIDTRELVTTVTDLQIVTTPDGVIVQTVGLPPTQGYWDVELVQIDEDTGPANEIRFEFRVRPPMSQSPVGTTESRDLEAAAYINNYNLEGVSQITVVGATNSRTARR